jgi:hypothetical protein
MYQMVRITIATLAVIFASIPSNAQAQVAATQIKLTEKQIEGFIAAQKDVLPALEKMQSALSSDRPVKLRAELETAAKKYGFRNFAEYEAVAANISMVMTAIDPQTKEFNDPQTAIKEEIELVRADKTIPNNQKKRLLEELNESLNAAQSIQFPTNLEVVKKYYDKLDVTTIAAVDDDTRPTSSAVRTIGE